jgi:hypothetical protein
MAKALDISDAWFVWLSRQVWGSMNGDGMENRGLRRDSYKTKFVTDAVFEHWRRLSAIARAHGFDQVLKQRCS